MEDFYDEYRRGFGAMALLPDAVDAVCYGLLRDGAPREAIQILNAFDLLPEPVRSQSRKNLVWLLRFVPRPSHADDSPKHGVSEEDYQSIDDPVWDRPSMALFKDGDPEPLAKLLLEGLQPPSEVSQMLGRMLLPSKGYCGYQLNVGFDGRKTFWVDAATEIGKRVKVARRYEELMSEEQPLPRKKIIGILGKEFGYKDSWIEDAIRMDSRRAFDESQILIGRVKDDKND
jgi:hypothetical protein